MNPDTIDLSVKIGRMVLKNPVIPAAGTFGYGRELKDFVDCSELGALITKAISVKPKLGNPPPRFFETYAGALFSGGSQNVGLDRFIREKLPYYRKHDTPLIVNVRGDTVADFVQLADRLSQETGISALELVISCPNLEKGTLFSSDPDLAYDVVSRVRAVTDLTLIPKLSADITDVSVIARACAEAGADALSLINSPRAMGVDIHTRRSVIHPNQMGSLIGPCVKPLALRLVYQAVQAVDVPVIGIGGITGPEDALEFLIVGARAVEIGTYKFINPHVMHQIIEGIRNYLIENQIKLDDLVGSFSD